MSDFDHGVLNVPLSKRGGGSLDAQIDRHMAEIRRAEIAASRQLTEDRKAARETEAARPKLMADDVRGCRFVRDEFGWHPVVRVSAKSVTVRTPWSWTDRIPLEKVLEVRS